MFHNIRYSLLKWNGTPFDINVDKQHYNKNTFNCFEFLKFYYIRPKKKCFKNFEKGKNFNLNT